MRNPKVSIVIPVYNVERYIERCLTSVIRQSISDIEILVIDDGSTDGSKDIALKYQKEDSRVHVYSIKNSGVSAARNYGLSLARGEYISFIDSDDEISKNYCELMLGGIRDAQICVGTVNKIKISGKKQIAFSSIEKNFVQSGYDTLKDILQWKNCAQIICNKMFERKFLVSNHLQFHVGHGFEDWIFAIESSVKADKVAFITDTVYTYWERDESATTSKVKNNKLAFDYLYVLNRMYEVLKETDNLSKMAKEYENHLRFDLYYLNRLYLEKGLIDLETYQIVATKCTSMIHDARHL